MDFISQYQYPLIGVGILIIMGLIGYMADQKESGKIAEAKKIRKQKAAERQKIKEQQKIEKAKMKEAKLAEKAKMKEAKLAEKAKMKEQRAQEKEKKAEVSPVAPVATIPEESLMDIQAKLEDSTIAIMEDTYEPQNEVAQVSEDEIKIEDDYVPIVENNYAQAESYTAPVEDVHVQFDYTDDNEDIEHLEVDTMKSESSVAFNSLLEEVQAEEASINDYEENPFLRPISNVTEQNQMLEEDEALRVFMRPTISNNESNDMTSDNLDEWKL